MSIQGARINRAKRSTFQRPVLAAFLCGLMLAIPASAQTSEATAFLQRAEALQSSLTIWQKTLNTMTFAQAPSVQPSLSDRRGMCLEWIPTIRIVIARVNKNPALGQQFSLLSTLTYFDNTLLNLKDALLLARTMKQSTAELATLEQDEGKVEGIRKKLHGFYTDLHSQLFQQLRATTEGSQAEAGPASHEPGEISGHVYRADTGNPLADAVVTLESPASPEGNRVQRTGEDGSYEFSGLAPGNYWVIAYRNGFVGSVYGVGKSQNASKGLIQVASGQKQGNIDFRVSPAPHITTIGGQPLAKELPATKAAFTYGPGSFSPEGKQFAFAVAGGRPEWVCVDSLASRSLKCVPGPAVQRVHRNVKLARALRPLCTGCVSGPGKLRFPKVYTFNHPAWEGSAGRPAEAWPSAPIDTVNYLAWVGDKLYAEADYHGGDLGFLFQLTHGSAAPFPDVAQAFRQKHNEAGGTGIMHFVAGNGNFTVTAWYGQLAMSNPDGEDPYVIATGSNVLYTFVFDSARSLVFYPVPGRYNGAIVSFNMNTRRYQTTPLPFSEGLKLLDVKRAGDTTLAAYTVDGPCVPIQSARGEDPWLLPSKSLSPPSISSVCLAELSN